MFVEEGGFFYAWQANPVAIDLIMDHSLADLRKLTSQ